MTQSVEQEFLARIKVLHDTVWEGHASGPAVREWLANFTCPPEAPSERQLGAIKEALAAVTRREVQLDLKVNPSIIGGLIVKVGSRMVDGSLRAKLNTIKHAMKEVS